MVCSFLDCVVEEFDAALNFVGWKFWKHECRLVGTLKEIRQELFGLLTFSYPESMTLSRNWLLNRLPSVKMAGIGWRTWIR